jgi:uncharacterized protein YfaS (alpha-2-macroglobulin family)
MLIGKEEVAKRLIARIPTNVDHYRELSYTFGSSVRDQAIILEVVTMLGDMNTAKKLVDDLSSQLSSGNWYSTQTTAFALMSIGKFVGETGTGSKVEFELVLNNKKQEVKSEAPITSIPLPVENGAGSLEITNKSGRNLYASVILDGIPLEDNIEDSENELRMNVRYLGMDGNAIDPARLEQGTDFMAEVSIMHPGLRSEYRELALTQMFPSGWEIRNLRLDNIESSRSRDVPDYQDIRDDRVYSYFGLEKSQSKTFIVLLNAAYLGEYLLPAVQCEAMYDESIQAVKAGKWVKVVEQ